MTFSNVIKTVSAEYTYYAPGTMSIVEAQRTALERAKIQAIADEFGTIVWQSPSTVISTKNGESDSHFFSLGGSDVKGEWIETIGEPVFGDIYYQDNLLVVPCSVKGKIREINSSQIEFIAKPLRNGTDLKYESYNFNEGDDLFLYFKSPVDGFLAVFLVDEASQNVYCALPYRNSDGNPKPVNADVEYILFSKKHSDPNEKQYVNEYIMTVSDELEFNDLYILFSPKPFAKAALENTVDTSLPKTINWYDFQKWLAKTRAQKTDISVSKIIISISKMQSY